MVERLLLDRVDAEARRAAVGRQHHRVAFALAHEARAALALVQAAVARAQVALDATVVESVPPAAGEVAHRCCSLMQEFALGPFGHAIAGNVHLRAPEIRRQPRLALQRSEEVARLGKRFPDLRQEGRAMVAVLEHQAVDVGPQSRQQIGLVADVEALVGRQQRHLDGNGLVLDDGQRRKPRVAERGGDGVLAHVDAERAQRLQRADAAAQFVRELQRHERGRRLRQRGMARVRDRAASRVPRRSPNARSSAARGRDQRPVMSRLPALARPARAW